MNILIFGAPGSGESTLGQALAESMDYFFMDTDDYFWLKSPVPYSRKRDTAEGLCLMRRDIETHKNCVIAGSVCGWGDELIPYIDLSVWLQTDTSIRIERICEREERLFGCRAAPGGDMYRQFTAFLDYAKQYDTAGEEVRSLAQHSKWVKLLPCSTLLLDGAASVSENIALITERIRDLT